MQSMEDDLAGKVLLITLSEKAPPEFTHMPYNGRFGTRHRSMANLKKAILNHRSYNMPEEPLI